MTESLERELNAIKAITTALEKLDDSSRKRALDYAIKHLGIKLESTFTPPPPPSEKELSPLPRNEGVSHKEICDIRSLRDEKKPSSDTQMTALVAYYLSSIAPDDERKKSIGPEDINKYFTQAKHPLPTGELRYALVNAKNAGYIDSVGQGQYGLNAVGHNLVVHSLPKSDSGGTRKVRKKVKKKKVPTTKKKSKKVKKAKKKQ